MNYQKKLEILRNDVELVISTIVREGFLNTKYNETLAFNLPNSSYLSCITPDCLVNNYGFTYPYSVLKLEELCEIADYLKEGKKR